VNTSTSPFARRSSAFTSFCQLGTFERHHSLLTLVSHVLYDQSSFSLPASSVRLASITSAALRSLKSRRAAAENRDLSPASHLAVSRPVHFLSSSPQSAHFDETSLTIRRKHRPANTRSDSAFTSISTMKFSGVIAVVGLSATTLAQTSFPSGFPQCGVSDDSPRHLRRYMRMRKADRNIIANMHHQHAEQGLGVQLQQR
jgi:hypothetical protein